MDIDVRIFYDCIFCLVRFLSYTPAKSVVVHGTVASYSKFGVVSETKSSKTMMKGDPLVGQVDVFFCPQSKDWESPLIEFGYVFSSFCSFAVFFC